MDQIKEQWDTIKYNVKKEYSLSDVSFRTFIEPLEYYNTENHTVYIKIKSNQIHNLNYISSKYTSFFSVTISEMMGEDYGVQFIMKNDDEEPSVNSHINKEETPSSSENVNNLVESNLNSDYTFDTFVIGKNNNLAHSACLAVAENPGTVYNPLFIYGGPGLGKTHLMHSIGHYILQNNPSTKVLYVTSEDFTNEVIESIRSGNATSMAKVREKYRNVDVLMVDDIQFIIGKESTQEEFFHTFNALHEAQKQIVLSSDKPPREIKTLDERFRSRFSWGLSVDVQSPDYETRVAILRSNAERINFYVPDDIIEYIATNITSNIRELEGALKKIYAFSKLTKKDPTLDLAVEALKDMISFSNEKIVSTQSIIKMVAESYGIRPEDILSSIRKQSFVVPRQVVMYLCHDMLSMSYSSIATFLNKKDHSTVLYGVEKVSEEIKTNDELKTKIETIRKKLS